jgi:hypothetical protein
MYAIKSYVHNYVLRSQYWKKRLQNTPGGNEYKLWKHNVCIKSEAPHNIKNTADI